MPRSASHAIPSAIPIRRIRDHRTHYTGRCASGEQFLGLIESVSRTQPDSSYMFRWYVALHVFSARARHIESAVQFLTDWGTRSPCPGDAESILCDWLSALGPYRLCDIAVEPFAMEREGVKFALERSDPDESGRNPRFTLWPSDIQFGPPWDGNYDT